MAVANDMGALKDPFNRVTIGLATAFDTMTPGNTPKHPTHSTGLGNQFSAHRVDGFVRLGHRKST